MSIKKDAPAEKPCCRRAPQTECGQFEGKDSANEKKEQGKQQVFHKRFPEYSLIL